MKHYRQWRTGLARIFLVLFALLAALPSWAGDPTPMIAGGTVTKDMDLNSRLYTILSKQVGKPYELAPLGEGGRDENGDSKPLFRLDAFDCLTLTETSMALAMADKQGQAVDLLQRIRYLGQEIKWAERKHFTYTQWIPENQRLGLIRDITKKVGNFHTQVIKHSTQYNFYTGEWKTFIDRMGGHFPQGDFYTEIVPLAALPEVEGKLITPSLAFVVKEYRKYLPHRISHVAIILRNPKNALVVFEASKPWKKVVMQGYDKWVGHLIRRSAVALRKVEGVNFQEILPVQAARLPPSIPKASAPR